MSPPETGDEPVNLSTLEFDRPGFRLPLMLTGFVALLSLITGALLYDYLVLPAAAPLLKAPYWPFDPWYTTQIDWMLAYSLTTLGYWGILPLLWHPGRAKLHLGQLRRDPVTLTALLVVGGITITGLIGPVLVEPELDIAASYQPPLFGTIEQGAIANCVGTLADGQCHGTMRYPLGTTFEGRSVLTYIIEATRTPVVIGLVTASIIIPVAVLVGTVSAYFGGIVDGFLMRLVEFVQVIPPLIVYIILRFVLGGGGDMFLLVAVFGMLSWASVGRLVRNQALAYRDELFVTAAESAGGTKWYVTRRHVIPNLMATVVTATTLQIPNLILAEAALSFLNYGVPAVESWGTIIADGTIGTRWASLSTVWWISVFPVIALAVTVIALSVLGDRLDEVIDPRARS